jgi:hypothetical protein
MKIFELLSENKDDLKQEIKKNLGSGHFGTAFLKNNKVYKITDSLDEYHLANDIKKSNKNFESIVEIYGTRELDNNKYLIIREYLNPISDELSEDIGEDLSEIIDYFFEKKINIKNSQTNLTELFDNKFLTFLENLKNEILFLRKKAVDFDIEGLPLNIGTDSNGNYKLFDF